MQPPDVMSVSEFRSGLSAALEQAQAVGQVYIGHHRRSEFVVLPAQRYTELLGALEALERRTAVDQALASVRLEGLEPSPHGRQLLEEVAAGTLDEDQAVELAKRRYTG